MAYNYGPPPGAYNGRPPSFGGQQAQFQPPPNMPPINFNAPVIRLGLGEQGPASAGYGGGRDGGRGSNGEPLGNRGRMGLGADRDRDRDRDGPPRDRNLERDRAAVREKMQHHQPPTREEVARTIFIGGLAEGTPGDGAIESLLRCAGKLRRWTRARDADDRACKFGFAEYEDVDSLEAANEIFVDIEVPLIDKSGSVVRDAETGEVKQAKLLVVVDEQSKNYIDDWKGRRKEDDDARQFRIDGCKEDLRQALTALSNVGAFAANGGINGGEDVHMTDAGANGMQNGTYGSENVEVLNLPLSLEDELSDIPADMRATVAAEIKAFRDRSTRRDLDRMRREEDVEQAERQRARPNRLASPPPSGAPTGPGSASNGIPVAPRGVQGAPAGPRGYRGAQMPSDYVNGVAFVGAQNGTSNGISFNREDEDREESDDELQRQRQAKKDSDLELEYARLESRWLRREATRSQARDRERTREDVEMQEQERAREVALKRLREWDDDEEDKQGREEFYSNRSSWLRRRTPFLEKEAREDEMDRAAEARELGEEQRRRGMADDFMDQIGDELSSRALVDPEAVPAGNAVGGGFKMSLGSAATKTRAAQQAAVPKRAMNADLVEGLLEDEDDAAASGTRNARLELKPLTDTSTAPLPSDMTEAERATARQELAASIPTDTASLFATPLNYTYLTPEIITSHIHPFVEKKIVEYLGVQEDLLVDAVVGGLRERLGARAIVGTLAEALGDEGEAEGLMKKVWRMGVFWGECEGRGLV